MSTTTLRTAVDIATDTTAIQIAGTLANLDRCGRFNLANADTLLAALAAEVEHTDADKALAQVAMDAGLRAHSLLMVVKAALLALADVGDTGQLNPDLVDAIVAADPVVTESVIVAVRNGIAAGDAVLAFALIGELRRAQRAATATSAVPDTLPQEWTE